MSALKVNKQRYWVTFLLDDLPAGAAFKPGLLHITIVPWFVADMTHEEVIGSFKSTFQELKSIKVGVAEKVYFGPKKDVAVNLLEINPELASLHQTTLNWLKKIGSRWAVKNPYVDQEFSPHIRRREGTKLRKGDELTLKSLTLVSANRREDNIRTVAAKALLND